jgi:hypothetical protein
VEEDVGAGRSDKGNEPGRLIAHHYHMAHTRCILDTDCACKHEQTILRGEMR